MSLRNYWQLDGNLAQDPELRYTSGGTPVTTLKIAVPREIWRDGKRDEETVFLLAKSFGTQAEADAKYLRKGSSVTASGQMAPWYDSKSGKGGINLEVREVVYRGQPAGKSASPDAAPAKQAAPGGQHQSVEPVGGDWVSEFDNAQRAAGSNSVPA